MQERGRAAEPRKPGPRLQANGRGSPALTKYGRLRYWPIWHFTRASLARPADLTGVTVFFAASGYLITGFAAAQFGRRGWLALRACPLH